jgi:hypothetical protein
VLTQRYRIILYDVLEVVVVPVVAFLIVTVAVPLKLLIPGLLTGPRFIVNKKT